MTGVRCRDSFSSSTVRSFSVGRPRSQQSCSPLLVLPSAVDAAVEDASALNWVVLLILVGGSVALAATAITRWRKHFARRRDA